MPTGTPISLRCPKCRRGKYGYSPAVNGCRPTGRIEAAVRTSGHAAGGNGGMSFTGHRGEVRCHDCGHS